MKYLFILGRNLELSKAEVFSYFEKENIKIISFATEKNALLIEINKEIKNIINNFGGVIAIGEVLIFGTEKELLKNIKNTEIYNGEKNKLNYVLWDFSDNKPKELVGDYLKQRFKQEKIKASEKHIHRTISTQEKEIIPIVSSKNLIDEQYFIFKKQNELFFGKIIEKCNYNEIEKRDMQKPIRRQELAISPRLAKIMINLSQVKENQILLDPFCGIGVVLEEALNQNIKVIGIDKDKQAIDDCKKNLEWFGFKKENYSLINHDSRNAKIVLSNVLVTEPFLGETFKKIPNEKQAKTIIHEFENLIIKVINNFKDKLSGKIVFTSPLIKTHKKRISCDKESILKKTGFKLSEIKGVKFPINEFRKQQITGRQIFVLER